MIACIIFTQKYFSKDIATKCTRQHSGFIQVRARGLAAIVQEQNRLQKYIFSARVTKKIVLLKRIIVASHARNGEIMQLAKFTF